MTGHVDVPELVRQRARSNGATGRRWLAELPDLVWELAERWQLRLGSTYDGGTESLVVAATDPDDRACVLKVAMPHDMAVGDAFARSVLVHRIAGGRGCVALMAADIPARAMLLERLGPNLDTIGMPATEIVDTVAATLLAFWRPVDATVELPTAVDQLDWLARFITTTWHDLGEPCERAVIDRAIGLCDERADAFDAERAVLVHGDAHGWNTLDAGDGSFKLVDPEGLRSEPAHDLAVPMREYNEPLLAGDTPRLVHRRAERLAELCDADADAVWQWGYIERVSTGLANLRDFDDGSGAAFLEVARRCR